MIFIAPRLGSEFFPQADQADEPILLNDVKHVQRGNMKKEMEK